MSRKILISGVIFILATLGLAEEGEKPRFEIEWTELALYDFKGHGKIKRNGEPCSDFKIRRHGVWEGAFFEITFQKLRAKPLVVKLDLPSEAPPKVNPDHSISFSRDYESTKDFIVVIYKEVREYLQVLANERHRIRPSRL